MGQGGEGDGAVRPAPIGADLALDLIGRDREIDSVNGALDQLVDHRHGGLVVVTGPAGVGKSSLATATARLAEQRGVRVVEQAIWPGSGAPPLRPWTETLRALDPSSAPDSAADSFDRESGLLGRLFEVIERTGPVVIVLDDFHLADTETQRFGRVLKRALPGLPLLVLAAMRYSDQARDPTGTDLIGEADLQIRLSELDARDAHALLDAYPGLDTHQRQRCHQLGGGNPLLLHEAARMVADRTETMSISTEQMIADRLALLTTDQRTTLDAAAVIGRSVSIGELAAVCRSTPVDVLAVTESIDHLTTVPEGRFEFRHDLIRHAVLHSMRPETKLAQHRRIASVLEEAPLLDDMIRRADHAVDAALASPGDAQIAVEACRNVAQRLRSGRSLERAAEFMCRAADVEAMHPAPLPDPRLAVDVAEAVLAAGRLAEARVRFARAADLAESSGDEVALGRSALGLGGVWIEEERGAVERTRQLTLLRRSDRMLDADHPVLRARLRVRLAAEQVYEGTTTLGDVGRAVDAVRLLDEDEALAEALSLQHHVMLGPDFARDRLVVAREMIEAAERSGSALFGLLGRCWMTVDLYLLGDERADPSLEDLRGHAEALGCRSMEYIVAVLDVMCLFRRGLLNDAEQAANEAYELGIQVGDADAMAYLGGQVVAIQWARGPIDQLRPMLDGLANSPTLKKLDAVFPAVSAAAAAFDDDSDAAHEWLRRSGRGDLAGLARHSTWLGTMAVLTEAARSLDDKDLAAEILVLIEPYAELPVRPSLAVICLGPTARLIGILHAVLGELDDAVRWLRLAVDECERLANRIAAAITAAELAGVLITRGHRSDIEETAELLDRAILVGERCAIAERVVEWRRQRDTRPSPRAAQAQPSSAMLRHHHNAWVFTIDGREVTVGESVGLHHLAELLRRPDQPIAATALAGAAEGTPLESWSLGPAADEQAHRSYRARLAELQADIATARTNNDLRRLVPLEVEFDQLLAHLKALSGRDGRVRFQSSSGERARMRVSRAIRRSITRIQRNDDLLARELERCITTGRDCCYSPDPTSPRQWEVSTSPPAQA